MRIDQITKYKCNGCGFEAQNPFNWASIVSLRAGSFSYTLATGGANQSEDYCAACIDKMRSAVKPEATVA